jgi:hypothetical protein
MAVHIPLDRLFRIAMSGIRGLGLYLLARLILSTFFQLPVFDVAHR